MLIPLLLPLLRGVTAQQRSLQPRMPSLPLLLPCAALLQLRDSRGSGRGRT